MSIKTSSEPQREGLIRLNPLAVCIGYVLAGDGYVRYALNEALALTERNRIFLKAKQGIRRD